MRRISAYGVCLDADGRVLLTRADGGGERWQLPGGVLDHGQDPGVRVVDAFAASAGLSVEVEAPREVVAEIDRDTDGSPVRQNDLLVFDVRATTKSAALGEGARWAGPKDLDSVPLTARAARLLGRLDDDVTDTDTGGWSAGSGAAAQHQEFSVYALATDPHGNVLLTRSADGNDQPGRWQLPGGGLDLGESALDGLARAVLEETGQRGRVEGLLDVASQRAVGAPAVEEPARRDLHEVGAIFRMRIDKPTTPRVTVPGGSTASAAWHAPHEAMGLDLVDLARRALLRALSTR